MDRSGRAVLVLAVALGCGIALEILFHGQAPGVNVPIATVGMIVAIAVLGPRPWRVDPFDAWIGPWAIVLASFVALRADSALILLDLGAVGVLVGGFAASMSGAQVTRQTVGIVTGLAAAVVGSTIVGVVDAAAAAGPRMRPESIPPERLARVAPVVRGLLLVGPLVVVFGALFWSADPIFGSLVERLFSIDLELGALPARTLFVAAAAWSVAGLLWLVNDGSAPLVGRLTDPRERSLGAAAWTTATRLVRLGTVEALTVLVVLDALFAVFVALQLAYLFGGLSTLVAAGMTYADYARRGFFELLAVVALVGGILLALENLVDRRSRAYVAALLALVGLTAVVLASSFLRLRLYQDAYGWTELRFYVLASIGFLAVALAAAATLIVRGRSRWLPHALAVTALSVLLIVNVIEPQAYVARRNVERAIDPSLVPAEGRAELDVDYLRGLDPDAVPVMVTALPGLPERDRAAVHEILRLRYAQLRNEEDSTGWPAWNLARTRALEALRSLFGS